jgi:alpha-L-rhamnosidase
VEYQSVYGQIISHWERKDDKIRIYVEIPPNTSALVHLPFSVKEQVFESGQAIEDNEDIKNIKINSDRIIFEIGSGKYIFEKN